MDDARPLVERLFEFLEAFNQKRNPVVRDIERQQQHWWWRRVPDSTGCRRTALSDPPEANDGKGSEDSVLQVRRPEIRPAPPPPPELSQWLAVDWSDPNVEAIWREVIEDPDQGHLALSPSDATRLREWKAIRDDWAKEVGEDVACLRLFQWL